MRLRYSCSISWCTFFSLYSCCKGFLHSRKLKLAPISSRLISQALFSSNTDPVDNSKKYIYKKGIVSIYGSTKFDIRNQEEGFYTFWKKVFEKLDFCVISGDVSTIDENEFKVLGGYPGRLIAVRKSLTTSFGDFTAVFDSQNPFRIFVGQTFPKSMNTNTIGGIIYVDKDGDRVDSKALSAMVFSEDFRNGQPVTWPSEDSWSPINVFLCGDTLILASLEKEMYNPILLGVILKDDEVQSKFRMRTETTRPDLNGLHLGRWLCIRSNHRKENEETVCYDLKSFRAGTSENLIYDRVIVSAAGGGAGKKGDVASPDLIATLESLEDVSSYDITNRDGYPVKCIKCGQDTVKGTYYSNRNAFGYSSIYLGKAACVHCSIRYSISNERWECFLANTTLRRCSCPVQAPDYKCSSPHASRVRYSVKSRKVAPEKKGYQQEIYFEVFEETESPK